MSEVRFVYYVARLSKRGVPEAIKIGSTYRLMQRMKALQTANGGFLSLLAIERDTTGELAVPWESGRARRGSLEHLRHEQFAHLRMDGGSTEWFTPGADLLEHVKKLREAAKARGGAL